MGPDSSAGGYGGRRGFRPPAAFLAIALMATLIAVAGCGSSGHGAETDPEKGADAEVLNAALTRELTILDAYTHGQALLRGPQRMLGRRLRAQEQEYVDAVTKSIRGLGGDTEAEAEEIDFTQVTDQADFFRVVYRLEDAAVDFYVDKAAQLYTAQPRTLDAWLAAGHAQHLAMLPLGRG